MNQSRPVASGLMWFRRDLRAQDNTALSLALSQCERLYGVFVLDSQILRPLPRQDRRVEFILDSLTALDETLAQAAQRAGRYLIVHQADPSTWVAKLAQELGVNTVYANHDDEPYALQRDAVVREQLRAAGIDFQTCKDHVIFERHEVLTGTGQPYRVFTPYKNAWLKRIEAQHIAERPCTPGRQQWLAAPQAWAGPIPSLREIGFEPTDLRQIRLPVGSRGAQTLLGDFLSRIDRYHEWRDFPAVKGPSYLGTHLRFGTISVRELVRQALPRARSGSLGAQTWLNELIWRDFYAQILAHFPYVAQSAFKPAYDRIEWEQDGLAQARFAAWCEGRTGYPLVDAAMLQLQQSGYMHNRLRMLTASFLVKDLGIDWRWGERHFAEKLLDFDLASNNGGWQWASSTGCDAQPYFRIFNPVTQSQKFDPQGHFIKRYLPQLAQLAPAAIHAPWLASPLALAQAGVHLGTDYPLPLVQHDQARAQTLRRYASIEAKPSPTGRNNPAPS